MKIPRIKICCISSIVEAQMAISFGASALGLVGNMPSGPGVIDDDLIRSIAQSVPPPIATFLLTSEISVEAIIAHHQRTFTNTIQIVDALLDENYDALREALPHTKIVQVVHVINEHSIDEAVRLSASVDALLLDSGNPNLAVKELGGTGRVHNWKLSRKIVEQTKIPVFLAGGINAGNVKAALDEVQPFGFDLCSSVRTNGALDVGKLEEFMIAASG
jgi:phosphoribosylanthranilate isomerase